MENLNKISGIYIIINNISKKFYIGSACNLRARMRSHLWALRNNRHANIKMQRAYNKYGEEAFSFHVLQFINIPKESSLFKDVLLTIEQFWIDKTEACNGSKGYNIVKRAGSNIGYMPSDKTRKMMSERYKGRSFNNNFYKGIVFSEEFIEKMKIGIRNSKKRGWKRRVINMDTGIKYDHIKLAVNETKIDGSSICMVCRGKMEKAGGSRWRYIDDDGNIIAVSYINKRKKSVVNIDTLEVFESSALAAKKYSILKESIYNNLKGKSKSAGGFRWMYYEDYLKQQDIDNKDN